MDTRFRTMQMPYAMSLKARNFPLDPPSWSSGTYARGVTPAFVVETMTSYRGPRRRGVVNSMLHSKVIVTQTPFSGSRTDGTNILREYSGSYPVIPSPIQNPGITNLKSAQVMFELLGGFPTEVSLPNLILEIPQSLGLFKSIREIFSQRLSKGMSDATLLGSFGVAPLVGDVQKLWSLSGKIKKRLDELRDSAEKGSWSRFVKGIPCDGSFAVALQDSSGITLFDHRSDVRVSVGGFRKNVYGPPTEADAFSAYADSLGMTRPLAVAWEAVPFSFVADWFYPLGDHLANIGSAYVKQPWIFKEVYTSIKARCSCSARLSDKFNDVSGLSWVGGRGPTVANLSATFHRRIPGFPALTPNNVIGARFGLKQIGLTAALIGQRT